ncbi:hypothetical protein ACA910_017315 [Epithemia clementina (nom. ined.)]
MSADDRESQEERATEGEGVKHQNIKKLRKVRRVDKHVLGYPPGKKSLYPKNSRRRTSSSRRRSQNLHNQDYYNDLVYPSYPAYDDEVPLMNEDQSNAHQNGMQGKSANAMNASSDFESEPNADLEQTGNSSDFESEPNADLEKTGNFIDFSIGTPDTNNRNDGGGRGSDPRPSGGGGGGTQWEMTRFKNYMAIADVTHDKLPMGIENAAPDFSFFVASNGNVGLGKSYPEAKLHLVGDTGPSIRLENRQSGRGNYNSRNNQQAAAWDITASDGGFSVSELTRDYRTLPFKITSGADSLSLVVAENGNVGLGTDSPAAKLHVLGNARIDGGTLSVGQCTLNTQSCQWQRHRRSLKRNKNEDSFWDSSIILDEDNQDDHDEGRYDESPAVVFDSEYLGYLERQNQEATDMIKAMESRLNKLIEGRREGYEEQEPVLEERVKALEAYVAVLNKQEQHGGALKHVKES